MIGGFVMSLDVKSNIVSESKARVLVGISTSPSNARLIETAANIAKAFDCALTALYVQTIKSDKLKEPDKKRLQNNLNLATKLGATVVTVYGDDVSAQIAEYAKISGITKIVIGRSVAKKRLFGKPTLTDRLVAVAPNIDIYIIPDWSANLEERPSTFSSNYIRPSLHDVLITFIALVISTGICFLFSYLGFSEANILIVYLLGVLITSILTENKLCWIVSTVLCAFLFNFFFTAPQYSLVVYDEGFPITCAIMVIASLISGSVATKMKNLARKSSQAAYRTNVLLEANILLQKAESEPEIYDCTAKHLQKLLNREIVLYQAQIEGELIPQLYGNFADDSAFIQALDGPTVASILADDNWTCPPKMKRNCSIYKICGSNKTYGLIGINTINHPISTFEHSIIQSIVGECALALENIHNAKENELGAIKMKNEKMRADLLRSISHDLRTPLTSISGNANNLMNNDSAFDAETKQHIYSDIYEDSMWLISLVENLLSITRLDEDKMRLNLSTELIADVINEALRHTNRHITTHTVNVVNKDEFLCAQMDARLIAQVIINLVDNAIKYTPDDSTITITSESKDGKVVVSIADNGKGISDSEKSKVFDMFYTGDNPIADSRRSLGLGLALCKSIILAHGGELTVCDNKPRGTVFVFTLNIGEVQINE